MGANHSTIMFCSALLLHDVIQQYNSYWLLAVEYILYQPLINLQKNFVILKSWTVVNSMTAIPLPPTELHNTLVDIF
jgi:hypothetical protein